MTSPADQGIEAARRDARTVSPAPETVCLIRIPRHFYYDHRDRDLDTPVALRSTKRHVWIDPADSALAELLSDASYYSDPSGFYPEYFGLCMSARATAKAIESFLNMESA